MKEHPNFYENLKEAHIRLRNTVVMYDGEPMYIFAITAHMKDEIFRVYMHPLSSERSQAVMDCYNYTQNLPPDHPSLGPSLDAVLEAHKEKCDVLRKHMNSPMFGKFRPFPLGMCNIKGVGVHYVERQPNRHTPQGLTASMLYDTEITTARGSIQMPRSQIQLISNEFRNCVLGNYPTPQECLAGIMKPDVVPDSAAFHRQFALIVGPIEMVFLAYKEDIIGMLPNNDFSLLRVGREFKHCREVVQELGLFEDIVLQ